MGDLDLVCGQHLQPLGQVLHAKLDALQLVQGAQDGPENKTKQISMNLIGILTVGFVRMRLHISMDSCHISISSFCRLMSYLDSPTHSKCVLLTKTSNSAKKEEKEKINRWLFSAAET